VFLSLVRYFTFTSDTPKTAEILKNLHFGFLLCNYVVCVFFVMLYLSPGLIL